MRGSIVPLFIIYFQQMKQRIWLLLTFLLAVLNDSCGASSTKGGYRYQRIKVERVWIVQLVLLVTIH